MLIGTREFVCSVSGERNENERRSLARKLAVSERRVETGARRSEDSEGQTGRRLAIAGMQAMTAFAGPDVDLPFIADDGETVLAHETGPVEQTHKQECCSNESTD